MKAEEEAKKAKEAKEKKAEKAYKKWLKMSLKNKYKSRVSNYSIMFMCRLNCVLLD